MPQTIYEVLWIFIVYAVIGWCSEVAYAALDTGKFVNRGFLNGPYCPIYGFGISLVIVVLTPLKENLLILYIGSVILTSVIEYITGYLLEKVFHNKWWDYSDKPYNIKGYICLKFSLFWGFACTFIVLILHPIIYGIIKIVPFLIGVIILTVVLVFFAIDCGITVATIMKFNERLKRMNEIAQRIHHLSDEVGENIYENVTEALEKKEKFEEEHEEQIVKIAEKKENIRLGAEVRKIEGRMEIERLKEQYRNMLEEKINGHNRLMKAFPKMTSDNHNETLQRLKTYIEKRGKSDDKRSKRNHRKHQRNVYRSKLYPVPGYGQSHEKSSRRRKIRTWNKNTESASGKLSDSRQ